MSADPVVSKRQLVLGHAVLLIIAVGSFDCILRNRERWPFSQYPMYSKAFTEDIERTRVVGVMQGGDEIALSGVEYWGGQLKPNGIRVALRRMSRGAGAAERLDSAARYLRSHYRRRRDEGHHAGPKLRGLRFYSYEWKLKSGASNVGEPDRRTLVREFMWADDAD